MQITPGFDFGVNEVPTQAKLQAMLSGMSITGIAIGQIATALVGSILGDTSASMPAQGWLRVDSINRVWVLDGTSNQTPIDRANWGGWETRQFWLGPKTDTWPFPAGQTNFPVSARHQLIWQTVNDSNATNIALQATVGAVTQMTALKQMDTGVSGSYVRVLGRGGCTGIVNSGGRFSHPDYINANQTLGATGYTMVRFPYTSIAPNAGLALQALFAPAGLGLLWQFGAYQAAQ